MNLADIKLFFKELFADLGKGSTPVGGLNDILMSSRRVVFITAACLLVLLLWAALAEIDEVTRAPGSVIASSRTQLIQSQDGGVLEELLVKEGDTVTPGQVLARVDKTRAEAAYLETRGKVAALTAHVSRLMAELLSKKPDYAPILNAYPQFIERQNALLKIRRRALEEELKALKGMLSLAEQELNMNKPLLESGDVSRSEILRLQRQVEDIRSKLTQVRNDRLTEIQSELTSVSEELDANHQLLKQRKSLLDKTELRSPSKGIVKNVRITTVGGVVKPGDDVMQIVPLEDDLLVEAKVSPADIAFISEGMKSVVKVDAYDYTIYGDLPAEVVFISADTIDENLQQGEMPYYRVRVKASKNSVSSELNSAIEIQPGMTSTVEIVTGKKSVLQYLTKPIIKTFSESMRER